MVKYVRRSHKRSKPSVSARTRITKRYRNRKGNVGRRGFGRRRARRVTPNKITAVLTDLLVMPDYWDIIRADDMAIPASSSTLGMPCVYFTALCDKYNPAGAGTNLGDPWGHSDPLVMRSIAQAICTQKGLATAIPLKFSVKEFDQEHTLYNRSNTPLKISAYYCMWRRDIPINSGMQQVLQILGNGFLSNNIGTGAADANTGLTTDEFEPFQSADFVVRAAIRRKSNHVIQPGQELKFKHKHSRPFMVRPYLICNTTGAGASYSTSPLTVDYMRGERFYLFKATPAFGDRDPGAVGSTAIASGTRVVSMITKSRWTYKYIESDRSTTTFDTVTYPTGIIAPSGAGTSINPLTAAQQTSAGVN